MIRMRCGCGNTIDVPETGVNKDHACKQCSRRLRPVCAEALSDGAGGGDFDAMLLVRAGPKGVAEQIVLGGCAEIGLGKLPASAVALPGNKVSRQHAKLARVDFGPSRWKIVDTNSTNGLFVNDNRVAEHDLQAGDKVNIGEYTFEYTMIAMEEPLAVESTESPAASKPVTGRRDNSRVPSATPSPLRTILTGAGFAIFGLAGLALTAGWPMYQVLNEEAKVTVYFKGIIVFGMMFTVGLLLLIMGDKGLPRTANSPQPRQPRTAKDKVLFAVIIGIPFLFIAYLIYFFHSHGYSFFH